MGDAMATHYEARACAANPAAYTWMAPLTHRPPVIASAIGQACLDTLYAQVGGGQVCVGVGWVFFASVCGWCCLVTS